MPLMQRSAGVSTCIHNGDDDETGSWLQQHPVACHCGRGVGAARDGAECRSTEMHQPDGFPTAVPLCLCQPASSAAVQRRNNSLSIIRSYSAKERAGKRLRQVQPRALIQKSRPGAMPEGEKRDGMGWDGMRCEAKRREGRRAMGREAGHDAVRPPTAPIDGQSLPWLGPGALPRRHVHGRTYEDACDECQPEERAGWMHARAHRKHHSTAQPARSANFHSRRQVGIAAGARARQPDRTHPPAAPGPCQAPSPGSARKAAWGRLASWPESWAAFPK